MAHSCLICCEVIGLLVAPCENRNRHNFVWVRLVAMATSVLTSGCLLGFRCLGTENWSGRAGHTTSYCSDHIIPPFPEGGVRNEDGEGVGM